MLLVTNLAQMAVYTAGIEDMKGVQDTVNEYYNAKDRYTDVSQFAGASATNNDYLDELVYFLEAEMPSDITISNMSVNNGAVTISCSGQSKDTLASFIIALKEQRNIYGVNVGAFNEVKGVNEAITISYTITFNFSDFPDEDETTETDDIVSEEEE